MPNIYVNEAISLDSYRLIKDVFIVKFEHPFRNNLDINDTRKCVNDVVSSDSNDDIMTRYALRITGFLQRTEPTGDRWYRMNVFQNGVTTRCDTHGELKS